MNTTTARRKGSTRLPSRQDPPVNGRQGLPLVLLTTLILILITIGGNPALALDYPHTTDQGVACFSCHSWSDPSRHLTDALCQSCHNGTIATRAVGHSSLNTSNKYGSWAMACTTCHQPHIQEQYRFHGDESLVVSGLSDAGGIRANTLTMTGAGWEENSLIGLVLFPDLNLPEFGYKILGNTADTITVRGAINLARVGGGNTRFGVIHGGLVRGAIMTPNSGEREVRLFRDSGTNSFADGDADYDGVCEVCHTRTRHHHNDGLAPQPAHYDGGRCISCHPHANGFAGLDHTAAGFVLPVDLCLGCHHSAGSDLVAGVHGNQCGLCHIDPLGAGPLVEPYETTAPSGGLCTVCHDFNQIHGNVNHTATPGSGAVAIFADRTHDDAAWAYGQPGPHFDIIVDCTLCHTSDLPAAHGNDCSTCHPSPYDSLSTWEGGCQQGGCHADYHGDIYAAHDPFESTYGGSNDCTICHASGWDVPQSNCLNCHAGYGSGDRTPPVTGTDALAEYTGPARIRFSIQDNGKVGIGRTFYKLDGGPVIAGAELFVSAPGAHTLEFWSVDQAGNIENQHKFVYFIVFADTAPPITTSNALSTYYHGATITLGASDAGTLGVKQTYFRINDGPIQTGTRVSIPATSGTLTYTLRFWSEDWSGNIESPKQATFTVTGGTGKLRLVWGDSDRSGSPCAGDPEANAAWTIRRGTNWSSPIVASGSGSCPNWSGVNDVTLPVGPTGYLVIVDWWDSYGGYDDQTVFANVKVTTPGQVIRLSY